jgi:two-component system, OmpR family, response regulator
MLRRKRDDGWDGKERRRPPSVLIVNDEPDACELLVRFLGQAGFSTDGAGSDIAAMSRMVRHLPRCVVLDMQAGGVGSSLKILDQIRSHEDRRVNTARVVLCAPSPKNRSFSFQSGADAFLVRPFHIADLITQVSDVLARPQEERARHRRDELARQP